MRCIGLALICYLFYSFEFSKLVSQAFSISWQLLVVSSLLSVCCLLLKFVRWHTLLKLAGGEYSFKDNILIFAHGFFWGAVSPGRVGEFSKAPLLKKSSAKVPYCKTGLLVFFDRLFDVFSICICLVFAFFFAAVDDDFYVWVPLLMLSAVFSFFVFFFFFVRNHQLHRFFVKNKSSLLEFHEGASQLANGLLYLAPRCIFITLCAQCFIFIQSYLIAQYAFELHFSFAIVIFIVSLLNVTSVLPISVHGLGTSEMVILVAVNTLWSEYYEPEKLIAFSLSLTAINFLATTSVSGFVELLRVRFCRQIGGLE